MAAPAPARIAPPKRLFLACFYAVVAGLLLAAWFLYRPVTFQRAYARVRFAMAGAHSSFEQAGPYRIHFYAAGSGRPIVLLHGMGGDALFWADYLPTLTAEGRVYAIDLLGHGSSDRPDVEYRPTLVAQVVRDFLDSQNIQQADLVGVSMGAFVALHVARLWPDRVRRLVVADSGGIIFDPAAPQPPFPQDVESFRRLMTPKRSWFGPFLVRDILHRMQAQRAVMQRLLQIRNTGTEFVDGKLQSLNMPVLILWGEQDLLTPLSWGKALHQQVPQSTFVILQGCGHIALYDCRPQALPEIVRFFSSPKPVTGGVRTIPPG
jgi:pimeloyl-ACP methyl ester carboxylesterase